MHAIVEVDAVDSCQISPKLCFEEGQRAPSVAPLVSLGARDIAPAATDKRVESLELGSSCL